MAGRMDAFNDAAEKLLWPEKRLNKDSIWRTQNDCSLHLRKEFVPPLLKPLERWRIVMVIKTGMIPKGRPVNLVGNLDPDFQHMWTCSWLRSRKKLVKLKAAKLSSRRSRCRIQPTHFPDLLAANKCPDFVEDKGHYFGTDLPDSDKRALIEYLKTLKRAVNKRKEKTWQLQFQKC